MNDNQWLLSNSHQDFSGSGLYLPLLLEDSLPFLHLDHLM